MNNYLSDLSPDSSSEQVRTPEGEISASLRVGFHVADDDVIDQFDLVVPGQDNAERGASFR